MSEPFGSNPVPGKYKQYRDPIMDGLELRHLVEGGDIPDLKKADNTDVQNLTLHQCAREGDVESITLLMNHLAGTLKKKINLHDEDELSPIHYAARYNNLEVVKLLVENGADVNDEGEEKDTPLHYAARYRSERKKKEPKGDDALLEPAANGGMPVSESIDDIDNFMNNTVVGYLISKGAKPNAEDKYGQTALHFAAMRGNEVAAGGLLSLRGKVNVDLEAVDKQRLTPLHVACIHNQLEIVRMLIDAGANLRCTTQEQSTPLHLACAEGHIPVVELLFEAAAKQTGWVTISDMVTDKDSTEYTCLHHAVDNGHYEITRMCIDKKADVNTPTASYAHPLHLAAAAGDIRIVRMLLDNHARIDALNDDQATALHKAAMYNHVEVVELLVKRGARIDRRDVDDFTPLLLAAVYGHKETLELLIRMGADFRVAEKSDKTALYLAAEENKYEALETLLSYPDIKSLINQGDRYDSEPLHIAAQNGFLEVCKLLLDNEADIDSKNEEEQTPLHLAAIHGRTQIVREIVSRDKRAINDEDESSNTPLHLAALYGNAKAVEALIKMGADVEARNYSLWTPLDCAASKGWVKTSRVLLENDAPVEAMDKAKTTPLHLASKFGHEKMVNLLLKWDASASQRDSEGYNCLDLAIEQSNEDCAIAIINSDQWEEALRNEKVDTETLKRDTPMRKLIRKMPDVAEKVFNKCMKMGSQKNSEHPDFEVEFTYEFLDDAYCDWRGTDGTTEAGSTTGSIYDEDNKLMPKTSAYTSDGGTLKKNHCLNIMVVSNREDLLAHPLVSSLLTYKWKKFGRFFYYINFLIYAVFLTFLTGYVVSTRERFGPADTTTCQTATSQDVFSKIGKYVIIVLSAWNLLRELLQAYQAKLAYFGLENLIEWVVYVTSVLHVLDFNDCQRETGFREDWQWYIGAAAIFLAWMNLVLFIQKFPRFGIYVVMFTDILKTFSQFFVVFLLFIIAFSLGFFVLLKNQGPFQTVYESLIKTSVMMIGEFEYEGLFYGTDKPQYLWISYVLFVFFMIIMSILIMNLLVGLAVDDIKWVQEQAALKRMAMQVDLALDVERLVPDFIRKKFVIRRETLKPNAGINNPLKRLMSIERTALTSSAIMKALSPELDEMERIEEAQDKLQDTVNNLRYTVKGLQAQSSKMESMLAAIIKSQNVRWVEEDFQDDED